MFFEELLQPKFDSPEKKTEFLQPYQWRVLYFYLALQCQLPILDNINVHFPLLPKDSTLRAVFMTTIDILHRIAREHDLGIAALPYYFAFYSKDGERKIQIEFDEFEDGFFIISYKDVHRRDEQNSIMFYIDTCDQKIYVMNWTEQRRDTLTSFRHLAFTIDQKLAEWIPQLLK